MKHKLGTVCLALLLALQTHIPASAAAEILPRENVKIPASESAITNSLDAPEDEPAKASPDAPGPNPEFTDWSDPQPGEPGIFQDGAFFGPQTIPSQAVLLDEYTAVEKRLYQEIEAGLRAYEETISITPFPLTSRDRMLEIFYQVVNDCPELFYCRTGLGWSYTSTSIVAIRPKYLYSEDEAREKTEEFDRCVSAALAQIDGIADPLEKVLTLHDYLAVTCKYAQPIPESPSPVYSAYGALVNREAVCQGYSLAFKLLMKKIDIPCVMVEGAESMNHVWNAVQLDGKWYHVDVTWDDPLPDREGYSRHKYFLASNDKMLAEGVGEGGHYGWNEDAVYPWGESEYDSGWIFNDTVTPLYHWDNSYYYINAPYSNVSHVYKAGSLRAPGTPVRENINRDNSCGTIWQDGRMYYVPYTSGSTLNVMALDLDAEKTVKLGEFTRNGNEPVGLRYENGGITVFRSNTEVQLGSSVPLPNWRKFTSSYRTYGLSEDGKYLLLDRSAANVTGKTLWVASYNSSGRMTFVGSVSSFPAAAGESVDLQMVPVQSCGTPSDLIKVFLLNPTTFVP